MKKNIRGYALKTVGAATAACFMMVAAAPGASAIEYGGFGGRPAYPRADNPRTESIFIHTLEPGAVQEEGVTIINNKPDTRTLLVFAADAVRSSDGGFACGQMSEAKNGVGAWIELEETEVTLDSMTNKTIPFTIRVPENAGVGEHNGCILIQEKKTRNDTESGMSLSFRTGLRVAITIPGELVRKLEIAGFTKIRQEDGDILLHPSVKNLGNVSIDANVDITTKTFFGWKVAEHGGRQPILRGEMSEWNFTFNKPFWGGWYRSSLEVSYDEHEGAGVGVESGEGLTYLTGPSVWFFSFPKPLGLVIEIAILLAVILALRNIVQAKRKREWIRKSWVSYGVQGEDNINAIASRHGVSWKDLAKANGLKPPYALKSGDTIRVPPKKTDA